ncbi:DUF2125 domain-containing protein [Brevundimonas vitis]|uniref:DUF2125 domain-containing protein n=1 Tax=Brevundimonas vitisensis TaxID=2800818 RepID=A0ABX7BJU5_9CAUL|nr:DUF2125 domain-containing protein [Brevundimonas vitisensis]QQQ17522.1 DUF2125 domain-containing protein [Brevundimonas vitisensis]
MTDHAPPARHSRRGLYVPLVLALVALAGWTGWWFWLAREVETRLDVQVQALRDSGWTVTHGPVQTSGWPFRVRVQIADPDIVAPSGQGLSGAVLVAEASAYDPGKWVVIAPEGLSLVRGDKGRVDIRGDALRLSASGFAAPFPTLAVELVNPVFTAQAGSEAFPISRAGKIELYTRPNAAAVADLDVLFRMTDAEGRSGGPVEGLAQNGRLTAQVEGVVEDARALRGTDAAGLFAAWTRAGGRFSGVRGSLEAGESRALLSSDQLNAGPDGRLQGQIALKAERPMSAIAGLAQSGSGSVDRAGAAGAAAVSAASGDQDVDLTIVFRDGRTWLGPFALAPAPKLF